jgi:transcriptional regulator with XRE-family HTH domain
LRRGDFAKLAGISAGYVTYIENGRRDPSPAVLQRWLAALGPHAKPDLFDPKDRAPPWKNTAEMLLCGASSES